MVVVVVGDSSEKFRRQASQNLGKYCKYRSIFDILPFILCVYPYSTYLLYITMEVIGSVEIYENARMMFRMFSTDVFSQCLA